MRFLDADGETIAGTERAVDRDTLIWRNGETFYRLGTDLPRAAAVAIAESLPQRAAREPRDVARCTTHGGHEAPPLDAGGRNA